MTLSSSQTASTCGTRARPSSARSTRASRSTSCALGGSGGGGGGGGGGGARGPGAAQDEVGVAACDRVGDVRMAIADRLDLELALAEPGAVQEGLERPQDEQG